MGLWRYFALAQKWVDAGKKQNKLIVVDVKYSLFHCEDTSLEDDRKFINGLCGINTTNLNFYISLLIQLCTFLMWVGYLDDMINYCAFFILENWVKELMLNIISLLDGYWLINLNRGVNVVWYLEFPFNKKYIIL